MRVLELFGGIGGFAAAVAGTDDVVAMVDHDLACQAVYAANWPHRRVVKNLASVRPAWFAAFEADLWWMSPPCAPHGVRGAQEDLSDPRSAAFLAVVAAIASVRPTWVVLENVPGFAGSRAFALLERTAERAGYTTFAHGLRCPTELGVPGVRRRFYAVLGPRAAVVAPTGHEARSPLASHLGEWRDDLALPDDVDGRFRGALHVVDADDPDAVAACFTRAYGTSPVYAGSYLRQRVEEQARLRRFAPEEIASLHGLPPGFSLAGLSLRDAWRRVGNGLSVPVVRHVLGWGPHPHAGAHHG